MDHISLKHLVEKPNGATIAVTLSLLAYQDENGAHLVYSPALDLFGSGNDAQQARESFDIALTELLRYATAENTLDPLLRQLGWNLLTTESEQHYQAPSLLELARNNPDLLEILDQREFRKYQQAVELSALAA